MKQPQPNLSPLPPWWDKNLSGSPDGLLENEKQLLRAVLVELGRRKIEALNLYEPMDWQEEFHASRAKERVIRAGNRAGKTLATCVEWARAVLNKDPHKKWPASGVFYVVGKDGREVANVLAKKLFRAGAFKIIRDEVTNEWRTFRPNDQRDDERKHLAKPAPPLIPPRFIKEIAWEDKKLGLPKMVKLVTGWEMHFFSGEGKPPHGVDIHGAGADEEIPNSEWYSELAARLVDHDGLFMWGATPQAGTEQFFELCDRAARQRLLPKEQRKIEEFHPQMEESLYLTKEQKDDFISKLSDEERLVRIKGEFAFMPMRVFPEYSPVVHHCDWFEPPREWTRYAAVDPGHQLCAVLFMAIPSDEDYAYLYDELYISNCNAEMFGDYMRQKTSGQILESIIIDHQEGRKVEAGSGRSIEDQFSDALKKNKVRARRTGYGFELGAATPRAGVEECRLWLLAREDWKYPKLRIMAERVPSFIEEIKRFRFKRVKKPDGRWQTTNKPEDRGAVHQMANFRYLVQSDPYFVPAAKGKADYDPVLRYMKRKQEANGQTRPYVNLGPTRAVT